MIILLKIDLNVMENRGDHQTTVGLGGLGSKLKMSAFFGLDKATKISGGFGLKASA
jgi:hypothetical protein